MTARRARGAATPAAIEPSKAWPEGLRTGDGVFETMRTFGGRPFLLDQHLERIRDAARVLELGGVPSHAALRARVLRAILHGSGEGAARERIVRLFLYAEGAGTGMRLDIDRWPSAPPVLRPVPVAIGISSCRHPGPTGPGTVPGGPVKWISRGPWSLALRLARRRGWEEALLADEQGCLIEGTRSNLVLVRRGRLVAPGPEQGALPGVTRGAVLDAARAFDLEVEERAPDLDEVRRSDEAFLTSSLLGIAAIGTLEHGGRTTRYRAVGPVTRWLGQALESRIARETVGVRGSGARARGPGRRRDSPATRPG